MTTNSIAVVTGAQSFDFLAIETLRSCIGSDMIGLTEVTAALLFIVGYWRPIAGIADGPIVFCHVRWPRASPVNRWEYPCGSGVVKSCGVRRDHREKNENSW